MRAEAEGRRGTEGCRALVEDEWVMQRRNTTEEELRGERQAYLRLWNGWGGGRQVAQGIHSFAPLWFHFWGRPCKCHVGIPSTNHSWNLPQSLWQSPAHPNYLSKPFQPLPAWPSYHSQWCWTHFRNKVRKTQQLLFVTLKVSGTFPAGLSPSIRCFYESYQINDIAVKVNFNIQISIYYQEIRRMFKCDLGVKCARREQSDLSWTGTEHISHMPQLSFLVALVISPVISQCHSLFYLPLSLRCFTHKLGSNIRVENVQASEDITASHVYFLRRMFGRYLGFTFSSEPEKTALNSQAMAKPHTVNQLCIEFPILNLFRALPLLRLHEQIL